MNSPLQFTAKLEAHGPKGAWTALALSPKQSAVLGSKARVPVVLTVKEKSYRTSAWPNGNGAHVIQINKTMQRETGLSAGDRTKVTLAIDDQSRTVIVPTDLKQALSKNKVADKFFSALAYSHQKEYVDWITEAKREETRERYLRKTLCLLGDQIKLRDHKS